jgi:oxygen-independent coproporphyrinogen-3 oxidase
MYQRLSQAPKANIYIHIPFCLKKCGYCYFYSLENQNETSVRRYLDYLEREIILKKKKWKFPSGIKTVYIGGGTPSYLAPDLLERLFDILYRHFDIKPGLEFTMEINPSFCDKEKLALIKRRGVNRVSFGLQTIDKDILKTIQRSFDKEKTMKVIQEAKTLGFKVINLDFMFCLPGQNLRSLGRDLDFIQKIDPTSVYWYRTRNITPYMKKINPDRQSFLEFDRFIEARMEKLGYNRLMTEFYTKLNEPLEYLFDFLLNDHVLGFGPFSISKIKNEFFKSYNDLEAYYQALDGGELPIYDSLSLNPKESAINYLVYLIRFGQADIKKIDQKFQVRLDGFLGDKMKELITQGFLKRREDILLLTTKGLHQTVYVQEALAGECREYLRSLNFFLGRGYDL